MRYVWIGLIAVLVFLAGSSGVTKLMQMPQDVEFFGRYGFNNLAIMAFGGVQLIGAVLLVFNKTRVVGAAIIFVTFLLSLVLLLLDGNVPFSIATVIAMIALVAVALRSKKLTALDVRPS